MVGIIDIGFGNIRSITNWLDRSTISYKVLSLSNNLSEFDLLILPGVGSAPRFINELRNTSFYDEIIKANNRKQRILGICLGAQILFENLEEDGRTNGFGFIKGDVSNMNNSESNTGWSNFSLNKSDLSLSWLAKRCSKNRKTVLNGRVYFNHIFGINNQDFSVKSIKINLKKYNNFSAFVHKDNLMGLQFHPEKSQNIGEEIIKLIY
jgi:imidazole glycerol-phosphate synthase subunit HisH